jgi:putative oxidoreductase
MSTHTLAAHLFGRDSTPANAHDTASSAIRWLAPAGRALYAAIFVVASVGHFSHATIAYAASQGVPAAGILVPLSGLLALTGGLSVMLGYRARIGAGLLVLFLVPVTLMMHNFWAVHDPMTAQIQQIMFMKNVSLLGGALLLMYFGAGPVSLDARRR